MRNLYLLDYYLHQFKVDQDQVEAFYLDEFSYVLYIILKEKSLLIVNFNKANLRDITATNSLDLSNEIFSGDKVINIRYIQENESLVIVTENGEIFQVKPSSGSVSNVGSIEGGILAASWSPNEERLVIASKNNVLLIFDPEFEPMNETFIDDGEGTGEPSTAQIDSCTISWRGDAKFFSTSFSILGGRKSLTRDINLAVFKSAAKADAEGGVVKSISEKPLNNVEKPLAWQTNGGIVASFEKVPFGDGKYKGMIIFWEKNGLRHGEFQLPYLLDGQVFPGASTETNLDIEYMEWNKESDLLALWARDITSNKEYVLVYHRSNYKWFLKKVVEALDHEKMVGFNWSYVNPYRLFIVYQGGHFELSDFWLDYHGSSRSSYMGNDLAWIVSVDHSNIHCTPTARCVVPPPMSFTDFQIAGYPNEFAVSRNQIVAIQNGFIKLFDYDDASRQFKSYQTSTNGSNKFLNTNRPRHLRFLRTHTLTFGGSQIYGLLVFAYNEGNQVFIAQVALALNGDQLAIAGEISSKVQGQITGIQQSYEYCHSNIADYVLFQLRNGEIFQYELGENATPSQFPVFKRPEFFVNLYEIELEGNKVTLGLTQNLRLYFDSKLITSECTSLDVYGDFVLFTTLSSGLSHILYLYNINDLKFKTFLHAENPQGLLPNAEDKTFHLRNVERGSRIVSVANDKVTMQMPRGNLETVSPRLLLLYRIKSYVMNSEYRKAYEILRQQKIDLNLLFDINVDGFLEKGELIVTQVEKVDYLNLLLTSLKDELANDLDYILTSDEIKHQREALTKHTSNNAITKTQLVCDLMIKSLSAVDRDRYILSIMTAYIKENELAIVLDEIIKIKDEGSVETEVKVPPHLDPATMKKHKPAKQLNYKDILEYVCWIADADRLYEFSLATYNLDLVAMVAQQTQKDPKEYIPYLDALKAMTDPVEMKYKVTMDLKKYDKAVEELSKGNPEQVERGFNLIKQHNLYHHGLKLFTGNEVISKRIKEALGDYLHVNKDYKLAGLVLESCGAYAKALESFKNARNAKKTWENIQRLGLDKEKLENKIQDCVTYFTEKNAYNEVAAIYEYYSPEEKRTEIAQCYAKTGNWLALTSVAQKSADIWENIAVPAIKLEANLKINALLERINEYQTKYQRFLGVQEKKRLMPLIMGNNPDFQFDSDASSDFTDLSSSSRRTKSSKASGTSTSSKGSRKSKTPQNLLKRKVKEGSLLEEEYLVGTLNLLKFNDKLKEEYEDFMQYLVVFGFYEQVERIQGLLEKLAEISNKKIKSVKQADFEAEHPELIEIYPDLEEFKEVQQLSANLFSKYKFVKGNK